MCFMDHGVKSSRCIVDFRSVKVMAYVMALNRVGEFLRYSIKRYRR